MAPNTRYEWLRKNLDYGDYEEMSELLEKIDNLNNYLNTIGGYSYSLLEKNLNNNEKIYFTFLLLK